MAQQKSKLKLLIDVAKGLNEEMHKALVEFLKEHNSFIRTDNRKNKDTMYAYVLNVGTSYETQECAILAVALFGEDEVAILPDYTYDGENLEGLTDQEVLESDDWVYIQGGEIIQNATLYNLCECIEEYV